MSGRVSASMDRDERIEAIANCEYARSCGMRVISMDDKEVRVEMSVDDKLNGFLSGHGGAVFSIADQAFALCCNRGEFPQVAAEASIRYLKPARGTLLAVARTVQEDERDSTCDVKVFSGEVLIAEFVGKGHKLRPR